MLEWCHYHKKSRFKNIVSRAAIIINKIQLFIMSSKWPLVSPAYTSRFYKKAKELCKKETYDAVISVYTPADTLYAGYLLKKEIPTVRFIPYYLDALAGGWGPTKWSKDKIDKATRDLENKVNAIADVVISMKSSESYHCSNPLNNADKFRRVFLDVPTFVENKDCYDTALDNDKGNSPIKVLYSGSIHFPDRDPRPLLNHFLRICASHNVELLFMGSNNCQTIFDEYSEKSNGKIRVIGQFSHSEAMQKVKEADGNATNAKKN